MERLDVSTEIIRRWHTSQSADWQRYQSNHSNPLGVFSVATLGSAIEVGDIVASRCEGTCLDIGCGAYHRPSYMIGEINYMGIDPFFGDQKRTFPFAQAIAEELPFADKSFDCVTMLSSLEHFLNPAYAFSETHRVLREDGLLFIWFMARHQDDGHHCSTFSLESLTVLLRQKDFRIEDCITIREDVLLWLPTLLVIARN